MIRVNRVIRAKVRVILLIRVTIREIRVTIRVTRVEP